MAHSFSGSLVPGSMWPTRAKKMIAVRVQTMDADMEFSIPFKTTGKELFEKVANTIGLRETWYFGLQYSSRKENDMWIVDDKRIVDQVCISEDQQPAHFWFLVKFYPEQVDELIQEVTQHLLYLQVKKQILSQEIYAPAEKCVLLASYAFQAKYGDYDPTIHKAGCLGKEPLIPENIMKGYKMNREGWEEKTIDWYAEHIAIPKEIAIMKYLEIAQDLQMFGVNYFPIKNRKGSDLWLGVDAQGLNVYEKSNRLSPKISFPWSEVKNISFQDKKFIIKPVKFDCEEFRFFVRKIRINRMILQLCVGNYDLYMQRRKEDTLVVQALKQQAKEDKKRKQAEQNKLEKERKAREEAVKQRQELEFRLRKFEGQARKANEALVRSEETAESLEEKLKMAEGEAHLLAKKATEAQQEIIWVKQEVLKSREEKQMLIKQVQDAEEVARRVSAKAEIGAQEAYRLKNELDQAREAETVAKDKLLSITKQCMYEKCDHSAVDLGEEVDEIGSLTAQLENTRLETAQKSQRVQNQLNTLKSHMEVLKNGEAQQQLDYIHEEIVAKGEDKYTTLRRITAGETRSRIAFFQSL